MDVALECARAGGALALSRFRGDQKIDIKGHRNIVTETDVETELLIKSMLGTAFPRHKILSEETATDTDPSTGWTWVIDPIDGTKNYAIGVPFWCTNIALCLDARPLLGITYDPVHDETFSAIAGEGAFRNGGPIHASEQPDVFSAVVGIDLGYDDALGAQQLDLMRTIFPRTQGFRLLGSAALGMAYVACGRIDLYAHLSTSPWDVAPGIVLIREAGGAASARTGDEMQITDRAFAAGGRAVVDDFLARYASAASSAASSTVP